MFDMVMYADYTTLYCNINQNINIHEINLEFEKISHWLSLNKLYLTKFMVFHMAQRKVEYQKFRINNVQL